MLLDIPEQEKLEIGRILEFKRKHLGLSVDTLTDKVCSKNTYYKLLKSSIAESEIYDMLLNKVGLYYAYENKSHLAYDCLWDFFLQEDWKNYYKQIDELLEKIDKTDVQRCLPIRKHRGAREKRYSFGYAVFLILALMK